MEIKTLLLLITISMAASQSHQTGLKKGAHMAFFKWVTHNNELRDVPSSQVSTETTTSSSEESKEQPAAVSARDDEDDQNKDEEQALEARRVVEFLRAKKNRRSGQRRRCVNGICRRSNARLLRTLSAKFPKEMAFEENKEKDINLLDLLETSKPQVLMSMDKVRENFCKTQAFAQVITVPGCHPKTIINNFCYGQCNSFFIPNHANGPFRTCGNCEASKTIKMKVNLVCPGRVEGVHTVHVEKVLNCACVSRPSDNNH